MKRRAFIVGAAAIAGFTSVRVKGLSAQNKSYTFAFPNGWVGSEWRAADDPGGGGCGQRFRADKGIIAVNVLVQSKNVDVQGQIADINTLINSRVDVIIINPNSPTGQPGVLAAAKRG